MHPRGIVTRLRRDDDGALLIVALAFLALLGLLTTAVLGYADTSLRGHRVFAAERAERYAVDGGVEAAIEVLRDDLDAGRDASYGGTCPDTEPLASFSVNGIATSVTCTAEPGSGAPTSDEEGDPIVPEHSLLALGTHASEGIVRSGAAALQLNGSIYSRSGITSSGLLTSAGKVYAVGTCSVTVISLQPPVNCAPNGVALDDPLGADPSFEPLVRYAPANQTPPTPTMVLGLPVCDGSVFTLQPGRYTDARALTTLTTGCPNATIHLEAPANGPGVFYFDFQQVGGANEPEDHIWRVERAGVKVVGGTPKGWVAGAPAALPGACKTTGDAAPNHGVQLIFGGDSRVDLKLGSMEICGEPTDDEQSIAVYGVPTLPVPLGLANGEAATGSGFSGVAFAEGASDDAWASATNQASAHVEVGLTASIPVGATLDDVTVRVHHREADGANPQLIITPGNGAPACAPIALTEDTTAHTDGASANASSCIDTAAKLAGMHARFQVATTGGWAKLDSFSLEVTYNGTLVAPLTGCAVAEPYATPPGAGSSDPCAVVHTSPGTIFAVQGTMYAPTAPIHLELGAASVQTVSRGIIARTIRFDATVGIAIPGNPIGAPVVVTRADREVRIEVSIDGVPRVDALVRFGDGGGLTPGATVDVLEWTFL
jgi:hypothetical protein